MEHADELEYLRFFYKHVAAGPGALVDVENDFIKASGKLPPKGYTFYDEETQARYQQ